MDATIPWATWVGLIEPHYYSDRPGKTGRNAKPVATVPRMYLLQVWFNLSGEGVEDAIYDSYAMRRFMDRTAFPQLMNHQLDTGGHDYGRRDITACPGWHNPVAFIAWIGENIRPGL